WKAYAVLRPSQAIDTFVDVGIELRSIGRARHGEVINLVCRKGSVDRKRAQLVGTIPAGVRAIESGPEGAFEGLILPVDVVVAHEADPALAGIVVHPERVFPAGDRVGEGLDPIGGPDLVSRSRKRIGVENPYAIRALELRGNYIVGEGLVIRGVPDCFHRAEEGIRCAEQLAEIALSHRSRWHSGRVGLLFAIPYPFLRDEEEHLIPLGVEFSRDEHRTADRIARLIEPERRR